MDSSVEWLRDPSPAEWIRERLHGFAVDVGSVVPDGFQAYARILHPLELPDGTSERWSDIAVRNGRVVHPEMQFHMINRAPGTPEPDPTDFLRDLEVGSLPVTERQVLVERLRGATSTPDRCWFCVWEGYGDLDDQGVRDLVRVPNRAFLLAHGSLDRAIDSFAPWRDQSANLWWPDDRAWVVASEIDFAWTYVAASAPVVDALVDDTRIEALEARVTDRFTYDSDLVNAALDNT
jgi:hypothetical protein